MTNKFENAFKSKANLDSIGSLQLSNGARLKNKYTFIPISQLQPSKINEELFIVDDELKGSIIQYGLRKPLSVFMIDDDKYEIQSGNRRYTAIMSLMKDDPNFNYIWDDNEDDIKNPELDGLPCFIKNKPSDYDKNLENVVIDNKDRGDLDRLEKYRLVMSFKSLYERKNERGEIKRGDGGLVQWLADNIPVKKRTIERILSDEWKINSKNYDDVVAAGSYTKWNESNSTKAVNNKPATNKLSPYHKELRKIDSFKKSYLNIDSKNFNSIEKRKIKEELEKAFNEILESF